MPNPTVTVKGGLCGDGLPTTGYCGVTLWPNGAIPYSYDSSVQGPETLAGTMQYNVRQAMNAWESATSSAIRFVQDASQAERVVILMANTCSSGLPGMDPTPGVQYVWWAPNCYFHHELGHVIGLYHEHARADRDRYVNANPMSPDCNSADTWKTCVPTEDDGLNLGEYDLSSTEQYFSTGTPWNMTRRDNGQPITTGMGAPTLRDGSDVVELYARAKGAWKRSVSMGIDVGATAPLSNSLASGVTIAVSSSPAVARSKSTISVFVQGSDNHIYRRSSSALGKPVWGAWTDLGGNASSSPGATSVGTQAVVAIRNPDGNVYINEGGWPPWSSIGKPASVSVSSAPALVASGPSQLDVFVRGSDNALWHRRRGTQGIWSAWASRGGTLAGTPAAVSPSANVVHVFSNSPSHDLVQLTANPTWGAWSTVGCCLLTGSGPAAASPNPTRIDVLIRTVNGDMSWKRWDAGVGWSAFKSLGGLLTSDPTAAALGTARIDVFFVGDNGGLWHRQHTNGRMKGDFDGDGRGDLALYRPSTNTWHIGPSSGAPAYFRTFPGSQQPGIPDDFDNDGKADMVVFTDGTTWTVHRSTQDISTEDPETSVSWGNWADVRLNGDFNGDGLADFVLFRPWDGNWWILPSRGIAPFIGGAGLPPVAWGDSNDVMIPGDYDGDGRTDVALYRPYESWSGIQGQWYIINSSTGSVRSPTPVYGYSTDQPVPADYDGDGKIDIAIYRPSEGNWYVLSSVDGTETVTQLGTATDRPVPKDYDGDGKADRAVFTPSSGNWRIRQSVNNIEVVRQFGEATDVVF